MPVKEIDPIYDVILVWNECKDSIPYKKYCSETMCNLLGYNAELSVKLVYEAIEKTRTLMYSTRNIDKASDIRDKFLALGIDCVISKTEVR